MQIGTRIGPYEIRQPLGQGGMAQVWKAWHLGLHRFEALKIPTPPHIVASTGGEEWAGDERAFIARFLHEARIAAGLRHPHIATIYGVSEEDAPQPFFAMELVEGGDLAALLQARGSLSPSEALPILEAIASALDYAHGKDVIHRDIKPANVLLEDGPHGWSPKVADFGIAHAGRAAGGEGSPAHLRMGQDEVSVGTPEYMSPEQAGSGEEVGPRSDIYSLGVVAYEMLSGRPPFAAQGDTSPAAILARHLSDPPPPASAWRPDLPPALDDALAWALAKPPTQRPASATEFVQALRDAAYAPEALTSTWGDDAARLDAVFGIEPHTSADPAPPSPTLVQGRLEPAAFSDAQTAASPGRARRRSSRRWLIPASVAASLALGVSLLASRSSMEAPASTWEPSETPEPTKVESAPVLAPTATPAATATAAEVEVRGKASEREGRRLRARAESTAQQARQVKIEVIDSLLVLRKRQERDLLRPDEAEASRRRLLAQLKEALSLCEAALKMDPDNETAWEQKAASLFLMGRFEEAQDVAVQGLRKFPSNRDLRDARDKAHDRLSRSLRGEA